MIFSSLSIRSGAVLLLAIALPACAPRSEPGTGTPTEGQMRTHFELARQLRQHAVSGEVAAFRRASQALADLEPTADLPPYFFLQFGPLRYEARLGAEARTNEAAAQAAVEIARTCGDCHTANDVVIGVETPAEAPSGAPELEAHMVELSRVTRQLWAGLVGPDEDQWMTGAEGLVDAGVLPAGIADRVSEVDLDLAGERLQRLGGEAAAAGQTDDRVRALADIWGTCSDCHMEVGGR